MYKATKGPKSRIRENKSYPGERIEQKINRIVNNKEPIKDGAPLIYTQRKDGVNPDMNIRTDRWEVAVDAMDIQAKSAQANRQARIEGFESALDKHNKQLAEKNKSKDGGAEPVQGTTGQ